MSGPRAGGPDAPSSAGGAAPRDDRPPELDVAGTLLWVAPLLERYREVLADGGDDDGGTFNTLRLADALLDKAALSARHPTHPPQVALLGPTQSGKSTLTNVLLDARAAGISALAGYTVHATGFASGCDEAALAPLAAVLAPLRRVARTDLAPGRVAGAVAGGGGRDAPGDAPLDGFALDAVDAGPGTLVADPVVVWDTPDFDSIEAGGYRGAVLGGAAIADVLVLVASKDKYGDRAVWDMLELVGALGRPLVVVLNKLDAADVDTVVRAFSSRFAERFDAPPPPLVTLPFVRAGSPDAVPPLPREARARLGAALAAALTDVDRERQRRAAARFVEAHRGRWLAPLAEELAAASEWRALVAEAIEAAEEEYARRYLDDPRRYDTFNRALAELLTLLELPGVARTLARAREVVTWPARTLLGVGRRRLGRGPPPATDREAEVLEAVLEGALRRLRGAVLERREDGDEGQRPWWRALQVALGERRPDLERAFVARSEALRIAFEPRIEEAAHRLHERLRTQPALLATLRAARVTTDAAGVALAVKSGGLAPADLVLAPAMLSVTTLLTESALGRYLDAVRRDLQAEQRALVRRELLDEVLGATLERLARELDDDALLVAGLDPAVIRAAGVGGSDAAGDGGSTDRSKADDALSVDDATALATKR